MKLDYSARKDLVRDVWRMFSMYSDQVSISFTNKGIHINVLVRDEVDSDGVSFIKVTDWNMFTEYGRLRVEMDEEQPQGEIVTIDQDERQT